MQARGDGGARRSGSARRLTQSKHRVVAVRICIGSGRRIGPDRMQCARTCKVCATRLANRGRVGCTCTHSWASTMTCTHLSGAHLANTHAACQTWFSFAQLWSHTVGTLAHTPCAQNPARLRSSLLPCVFEWFARATPVKLLKPEVQPSNEPVKLKFWLFKKAVLACLHLRL